MTIPALLFALPALAQYPPDDGAETTPDASFACDGLVQGGTATCSVGGWQAGSEAAVEVLAGSETVLSDVLTVDANGFVSYSFEVPESAQTLQFSHTGVLADGSPYVHAASLDATEAAADGTTSPSPGGLPSTGEMVSLLLVAAVLALGIGIVAVRRGRTRVDTSTGA